MALPTAAFSLSALIKATADELRAARAKAKKDAVIQLTACEIELAVTVTAEAGGGIKFWLVDASAKGSGQSMSRIKLSFEPVTDLASIDPSRITVRAFKDEPGRL